jgi:hypothetical protein
MRAVCLLFTWLDYPSSNIWFTQTLCQQRDKITLMSFKSPLKRIAEKTAPGRTPSYGEAKIIMALETAAKGCIGRAALGKRLGLGEGVIRTLTKHMLAEGLVDVSTQGISASKKGEKVLREIRAIVSAGAEAPKTDDAVGSYNYALLVKGGASRVRYGLEQRDAALLAGAEGATTITYKGGRGTIPGMDRGPSPELAAFIEKLAPLEGDTIIVGTGVTAIDAETGAYSAALTLA